MSKDILVIYHKADFDGIFCREIAWRRFGVVAEYIGWDYGDAVPVIQPSARLYMLDISVEGLMDHPNLVWIDHHNSAMEKFDPRIAGLRIDGVAACRLAWQFFFAEEYFKPGFNQRWPTKQDFVDRNVKEPQAVRLAGEYDVWDKRDPDAEVFQFGLRSTELTKSQWEWLFIGDTGPNGAVPHRHNSLVIELLYDGKRLQKYQRAQDAEIVKERSFTVTFDGLTFLALNTARCNSLTFTVAIKPEHDALLGYWFNGTRWKVSLYHAPGKEQHDLSSIAKRCGGGGHRGACGFIAQHLLIVEGKMYCLDDLGNPLPVYTARWKPNWPANLPFCGKVERQDR